MEKFEMIKKHAAEILRAIRGYKYEKTGNGLFLPAQRLMLGHGFSHSLNGGPVVFDHNIVPDEMLNAILSVMLAGGGQITAWYLALFAGNVTPGASLTAATFTAVTTEFTHYNEATRPVWTPGAVAGKSVDNTASKGVFTADSTAGTVYGAALISAAAKSATTGKLGAASRFTSARVLVEADVLNVAYTLQAASS